MKRIKSKIVTEAELKNLWGARDTFIRFWAEDLVNYILQNSTPISGGFTIRVEIEDEE